MGFKREAIVALIFCILIEENLLQGNQFEVSEFVLVNKMIIKIFGMALIAILLEHPIE
jgi:hypothetical protein